MAAGLRETVPSRWRGAVLVCGKCSRKLGGGFGRKGRTPLHKALRRWLGGAKGRKASYGVVEVPCLKLCPRGAVCVVDTYRPDRWLLVAAGEDVGTVAARLDLPGPDRAGPDQAAA